MNEAMQTETATPGGGRPDVPHSGAEQRGQAKPRLALSGLLRRRWLWVVVVFLGLAAGLAWISPPLPWIGPHVQAWQHLRAGRREVQRYRTREAIGHLKACLDVWPKNNEALLLLARAQRRALRYTEAERLLASYRQTGGPADAAGFEHLLLAAE